MQHNIYFHHIRTSISIYHPYLITISFIHLLSLPIYYTTFSHTISQITTSLTSTYHYHYQFTITIITYIHIYFTTTYPHHKQSTFLLYNSIIPGIFTSFPLLSLQFKIKFITTYITSIFVHYIHISYSIALLYITYFSIHTSIDASKFFTNTPSFIISRYALHLSSFTYLNNIIATNK